MGVKFEASQAKSLLADPVMPEAKDLEAPPIKGGFVLSETDAEKLRQVIASESQAAKTWEFRYLNFFFAGTTQFVLSWLNSKEPGPVTIGEYEAVMMLSIPPVMERRAVLDALTRHRLVDRFPGVLELAQKGRDYAGWPERRIEYSTNPRPIEAPSADVPRAG